MAQILLLICVGSGFVYSSELMVSGGQSDMGRWQVSFYGYESEQEPKVVSASINGIEIPTSDGSSAFFSREKTTITMVQDTSSQIFAIRFKPLDGFVYRAKLGRVKSYELSFSSGSQTNKLQTTEGGIVWGLGLSGVILPGSQVSTSISWDIGFVQSRIDLDRFLAGSDVLNVNNEVRQNEFQCAVNFSRRWKRVEPYGGLKLTRLDTTLINNSTKSKVSGSKGGVSPFLGVQLSVFSRGKIILEASFVDEKAFSAGVGLQF